VAASGYGPINDQDWLKGILERHGAASLEKRLGNGLGLFHVVKAYFERRVLLCRMQKAFR
jgi:hypothetical protein